MPIALLFQKGLRLLLNHKLRRGDLGGVADIFGRIRDKRKLRFKHQIIDALIARRDAGALDEIRKIQRHMPEDLDPLYDPVWRFVAGERAAAQEAAWAQVERAATPTALDFASKVCFFVHGALVTDADATASRAAPSEPAPEHFQYWDRQPPADVAQDFARWRDACRSTCAHRVYNEGEAGDFLAHHFGHDVRKLYESCLHPAMKCDFFRLFKVYQEGGSYSDADARPRPGFSRVRGVVTEQESFWIHGDHYFVLTNWFLGAPKGGALYERFMDEACRRVSRLATLNVTLPKVAGPEMMQDVLTRDLREVVTKPYRLYVSTFGYSNIMRITQPKYKKSTRAWQVSERRGELLVTAPRPQPPVSDA